VVVPPAGYLAARGEMSLALVIASGVAGSLLGALFNYWLAVALGRPFLERYGRWVLVTPATLDRADRFFADHGHISTFIGRLLPGVRQYISLPAGVARMNLLLFSLFTALGAGLWVVVLALAGYLFGANQEFLAAHLRQAAVATLVFCAVVVAGYVLVRRRAAAG
jgi:membrane protein DedA with SNARE-associated domain